MIRWLTDRIRRIYKSTSDGTNVGDRTSIGVDVDKLLWVLSNRPPSQWSANVIQFARMFTGVNYLAVRTIATHAMGAKFTVHEQTVNPDDDDGLTQVNALDPLQRKIDQPNPRQSGPVFIYDAFAQWQLTGISLIWRAPDDNLYPLKTATSIPQSPSLEYPYGSYRVTISDAVGGYAATGSYIIPAEYVIKIFHPHPSYYADGYAVATALADQLDTLKAIDVSRRVDMTMGCHQNVAVELPESLKMPDDATCQRYKERWMQHYSGPQRKNSPIFLFDGAKVSRFSESPVNMGYESGYDQLTDIVFAGHGMNRAVAGLLREFNFATFYGAFRAFTETTMSAMLDWFCATVTQEVFTPLGPYVLKAKPMKISNEEMDDQRIRTDGQLGICTVEEVRRQRGYDRLDPVEYPWVKDRALVGAASAGGAPPDNAPSGSLGLGNPKRDPLIERVQGAQYRNGAVH